MKAKKTVSKKQIVVKDLKARKNPKGGAAFDAFLEVDGIKVKDLAGHKATLVKIDSILKIK